jgi:hypothetical protein
MAPKQLMRALAIFGQMIWPLSLLVDFREERPPVSVHGHALQVGRFCPLDRGSANPGEAMKPVILRAYVRISASV